MGKISVCNEIIMENMKRAWKSVISFHFLNIDFGLLLLQSVLKYS